MADTSLSLNMKQVVRNLQNHADLSDTHKSTYIQSVEKVCEWLDLPLHKVSTRKVELRPAIERLNASQLGIKQKTFRNRIASFNSALKFGADGHYRAALQKPNQAWQALLTLIEIDWRRKKIDQLAKFASANGMGPSEVSKSLFEDWLKWREENASLLSKPARAVEDAWTVWNWCAEHVEDWPTGIIGRQSRKKAVRLDRALLNPSLVGELDAYEARMTRDVEDNLLPSDTKDSVNAVCPRVARNRIQAIELCVACLVDSGGSKPEELRSVSDIVTAANAKQLVTWLKFRNGGQYTHYHRSLLEHLRAVAAQYIGFENMQDGQTELGRFNYMLKIISEHVGQGKMTKKNKGRLNQFDNPENIARLVNLPTKIFYNLESRRKKTGFVTCQMAYDARAATAILIELTLPLRRANLVDMRIGKELILPKSKRDSARIVIDGAAVKNDEDLTCSIPDQTLALIDTYLRWYRPVLIAGKKSDFPDEMRFGDGNHYLLPVKGGAPIDGGKLRQKVVDIVRKETGLAVTIHFFRHIAASMIMKHDPALAAAAGAILGHKDGSRVTKVYARLSSEKAANTYEVVKSDSANSRKRRTSKSTGRLHRVSRNHVY